MVGRPVNWAKASKNKIKENRVEPCNDKAAQLKRRNACLLAKMIDGKCLRRTDGKMADRQSACF
jgi:hypothetical protein